MTRPKNLPDYQEPPLHEVVMGVQFRTPENYQQIYAGEVWHLFRERFPEVEEHQRLMPNFETFGPSSLSRTKFEFLDSAQHDRFWFLTLDESELLQFQDDRFLHNWRRRPNCDYPRFERMAETFLSYSQKLERYFEKLGGGKNLEITQLEISYINHLPSLPDAGLENLSDYVRILNKPEGEFEDIGFRYRRIIENGSAGPSGRLYVSCDPIVGKSDENLSSMNLIVRGTPEEPTLESAMKYFQMGRDLIVNEFTKITTARAHEHWKRIK